MDGCMAQHFHTLIKPISNFARIEGLCQLQGFNFAEQHLKEVVVRYGYTK